MTGFITSRFNGLQQRLTRKQKTGGGRCGNLSFSPDRDKPSDSVSHGYGSVLGRWSENASNHGMDCIQNRVCVCEHTGLNTVGQPHRQKSERHVEPLMSAFRKSRLRDNTETAENPAPVCIHYNYLSSSSSSKESGLYTVCIQSLRQGVAV